MREIPQLKFRFDEIFCSYVDVSETSVVLKELQCIALSSRVMAILVNFRSYTMYFQHNEMLRFSPEILPISQPYNN
jgi:hypothetical protein